MVVTEDNKLKNLIIVGDRVLVKLKKPSDQTQSGLYLPPGVQESEKVQSGYIMKVGPGYPISLPADDIEESWKAPEETIKYIPLQVQEGDLAIFLQKAAYEVIYEGEKYFIVPQQAILMVERDVDLFD